MGNLLYIEESETLISYMDFKYFTVHITGMKPATNVYGVTSQHGHKLGVIKWYAQWRQYCFVIDQTTLINTDFLVFSSGCLADLQTALERLNKKHKQRKKP